jgi:hypothetical protein
MTDDATREAARKRSAKRKALVAHALRLTSGEPDGWHRVPLSRYLAKAHKVSEHAVLAVLDDAPELISVGFMIMPRPATRRPVRPPPSRVEQVASWQSVTTELVYFLSELQTNAVQVEVAGSLGGVVLRMRLDFVQERKGFGIWAALLVPGRKVFDVLAADRARALGPGWSLPLIDPRPDAPLPQVLVWRSSAAVDGAAVVRRVMEERLGVAAGRVAVRRDVCTPAELDRRVTGESTVRRLRQSSGRTGFAVRACDRCGQPLSDPDSVRLGIGPECRRYYSREVLAAVRGKPLPRPGTKAQAAWLSEVRDGWSSSEFRSGQADSEKGH